MRTLKQPINSRKLRICADDFAQNNAIDEGIIALIVRHRINAVSCLVNTPSWPTSQSLLKPYQAHIFIGLHLNFIEGATLSEAWQQHFGPVFLGHHWLIKKAYTQQLPRNVLQAEIKAQIDAFQKTTGWAPDFIDGHLHTHQLPGIRDALLTLYLQNHWHCAIRNTSNNLFDFVSSHAFPKPQLIALLGGISLRNALRTNQIPTNTSFAGIRRYNHLPHVRYDFNQFLRRSKPGGLIMCHPGKPSTDPHDPLAAHRVHEFNYLMSDDFIKDLTLHRFELEEKKGINDARKF